MDEEINNINDDDGDGEGHDVHGTIRYLLPPACLTTLYASFHGRYTHSPTIASNQQHLIHMEQQATRRCSTITSGLHATRLHAILCCVS